MSAVAENTVVSEQSPVQQQGQQPQQGQQVNLLDMPVTNENEALNVMVNFYIWRREEEHLRLPNRQKYMNV